MSIRDESDDFRRPKSLLETRELSRARRKLMVSSWSGTQLLPYVLSKIEALNAKLDGLPSKDSSSRLCVTIIDRVQKTIGAELTELRVYEAMFSREPNRIHDLTVEDLSWFGIGAEPTVIEQLKFRKNR